MTDKIFLVHAAEEHEECLDNVVFASADKEKAIAFAKQYLVDLGTKDYCVAVTYVNLDVEEPHECEWVWDNWD